MLATYILRLSYAYYFPPRYSRLLLFETHPCNLNPESRFVVALSASPGQREKGVLWLFALHIKPFFLLTPSCHSGMRARGTLKDSYVSVKMAAVTMMTMMVVAVVV